MDLVYKSVNRTSINESTIRQGGTVEVREFHLRLGKTPAEAWAWERKFASICHRPVVDHLRGVFVVEWEDLGPANEFGMRLLRSVRIVEEHSSERAS